MSPGWSVPVGASPPTSGSSKTSSSSRSAAVRSRRRVAGGVERGLDGREEARGGGLGVGDRDAAPGRLLGHEGRELLSRSGAAKSARSSTECTSEPSSTPAGRLGERQGHGPQPRGILPAATATASASGGSSVRRTTCSGSLPTGSSSAPSVTLE